MKKNGVEYKLSDEVYLPVSERESSRFNSWITLGQITLEFPEFFDKIEDIFAKTDPCYSQKSKDYAENVMTYLDKFDHLSWKQFDSVWKISQTYQDYVEGKEQGFYRYGSVVSVVKNNVSFTTTNDKINKSFISSCTDKQMDNFHENIFGFRPMFEEESEEGLSVAYRNDGSRFFALPTGDEQITDHMHFGISFKGLTI